MYVSLCHFFGNAAAARPGAIAGMRAHIRVLQPFEDLLFPPCREFQHSRMILAGIMGRRTCSCRWMGSASRQLQTRIPCKNAGFWKTRETSHFDSYLCRDYGPEDVFLPLDGQCFSVEADKYKYEVCPYCGAAQKEGASSTRWAEHFARLANQCGQNLPHSAMRTPARCASGATQHTQTAALSPDGSPINSNYEANL